MADTKESVVVLVKFIIIICSTRMSSAARKEMCIIMSLGIFPFIHEFYILGEMRGAPRALLKRRARVTSDIPHAASSAQGVGSYMCVFA